MTTEELVRRISGCQNFIQVKDAVIAAGHRESGWQDRTTEAIEEVCAAVCRNPQALRAVTIFGSPWRQVKSFFGQLGLQVEAECGTDSMPPHTREVMERALMLSARKIYETIRTEQEAERARRTGHFDGLYHANSVATSLAFLEEGGLFTRAYGEEELEEGRQTPQDSDEIDRSLNIYEDVFFDNCHIAKIADRYSYYGPVMFVYDPKVLLKCKAVRVAKLNPWSGGSCTWEGLSYRERIYTEVEEFVENFSVSDFGAHTMIYHPEGGIVPFYSGEEIYLKEILVERHPEDDELTEEILRRLREQLYLDEKLRGIPVRDIEVNNQGVYLKQELWDIPAIE